MHKAPQTIEDLVHDRYLRQVPIDPVTGSKSTWRIVSSQQTHYELTPIRDETGNSGSATTVTEEPSFAVR
jgi:hypothetical protein